MRRRVRGDGAVGRGGHPVLLDVYKRQSQYAVATIPATLDQVKVTPITRNDRHTVRHLFLLGANDNVLPTVETGGGLLDAQERELLQQRGILLSDATFDPLGAELQNIYACLAQPTASLTVMWPVTDGAGGQLLPSFVVERIGRLFPQITAEREDGAYRRELPASALALAGQETVSYTHLDTVLMGLTRQLSPFRSPSAQQEQQALATLEQLGVVHLTYRNFAELSGGEQQLVPVSYTHLIEKLSGGSVIYCAGGARSFKMENGSKITDCPRLNGNVIFAKNSTVVIDGEISNVHATGNHILQTDGGTAVTIGKNGRILNNRAYYGAVYINGTDEHLDI